MIRGCTLVLVVGLLGGCASGGSRHTVAPATDRQQAALIEQVKQLAGTWEMTGEGGKPVVASVMSVGSGGSVVREVLFPGSPHEMTDMYHMDGSTLVMTHYCSMGNQPRMRATAGEPGVLDFKFDGVTNMTSADQTYMGEMKLVIKDKNTIRQEWTSFKNGKQEGPVTVFEMKRKS
jgi:hypothetical protein